MDCIEGNFDSLKGLCYTLDAKNKNILRSRRKYETRSIILNGNKITFYDPVEYSTVL